MIIKYYKGNISFEKLREYTKTTRNGTTAYHMIETLKYLGFEAKGVDISYPNIKGEKIPFPCIAHMKVSESDYHYVVIYKINFKNETILIADPSSKIKKISVSQFQKYYHNTLIIMHPIRKIPLHYNYRTLFHFTLKKIYHYRKCLIKIMVLSLLITIFSVLMSFYFKFMVEAVSISSNTLLSQIFIVFLIINILKVIADYLRNWLLIYFNNHLDEDLTLDVFERILSFPYTYFKNRTTGEVISRIQDLTKVREMISKLSLSLSLDFILTLFSSFILYYISPKLFSFSCLILFLYLLILFLFHSKLNSYVQNLQQENSLIYSYLVESLTGIENIKGLHLVTKFISVFQDKYKSYIAHLTKFHYLYNLESLLKEFVHSLGITIILYIGSKLVIQSSITLGELLSFYSLLFYFLNPIRNIIDLNVLLFESKHAFLRIDEMMVEEKKKTGEIIDKIREIECKNLSFSIDDCHPTLRNISFHLKLGDTLMIVGSSGSGKSTLLKILKGYYSISDNMLFINQRDNNGYQDIGKRIAYISQNEILYTNTLYENIRLYREMEEEKIRKVCRICCIDEFIPNQNLHYLIEENGFNLSGGERQRITLARALLNEFDVLIIDEALSQVDINLERKIIKNIKREFYQKIIIFVSHRYENLDLFDQFLQMEKGSILKYSQKNKPQKEGFYGRII